MKIEKYMKRHVISIRETDTLTTAAKLFMKHHIGTLPVVNSDNVLTGIILIRDLLDLAMPDFTRLIEDFEYIHSFGVFEDRKIEPEVLGRLVRDVMEEPVSVMAESGLMLAAALLTKENLADIPVVDTECKLVGIASRVDIGVALLRTWNIAVGE